jgi:hypothetical protein
MVAHPRCPFMKPFEFYPMAVCRRNIDLIALKASPLLTFDVAGRISKRDGLFSGDIAATRMSILPKASLNVAQA